MFLPRSFFPSRFLSSSLLALAVVLPVCGAMAGPDTSAPLRVVCIGDSITQGRGDRTISGKKIKPTDGWRWAFWKKTVDAGIPVTFVGSMTTGFESTPVYPGYKGKAFENRHEARWGWTTEAERDILKKNGAAWDADVALIYLGTNREKLTLWQKMTDPLGVHRTGKAMRNLLSDLRTRNPYMAIAVRLPQGDGPRDKALDVAYRRIVADFNRPGAPAVIVTAPTGWVWNPKAANTDTVDGCHPNKQGDEKTARGFFQALQAMAGESAAR